MVELKDPVIVDTEKYKKSEAEVIRRVTSDFELSRSNQDPFRRTWDENYEMWRNKLVVPKNYPLTSRAFLPLSHGFVETVTPFYVDALYDDRQFIVGLARRKEELEAAKIIGQITTFQYVHQIGFLNKLIDCIRISQIYGTAYMEPYFRHESYVDMRKLTADERRALMDGDEEGKAKKEGGYVRRVAYSGPDIRVKDPYDVFPDYEFPETDDMRFTITRHITTLGKLKEMEYDEKGNKVLFNLDKLAETNMPEDANQDRTRRLKAQNKDGSNSDKDNMLDKGREDKMVELLYWWSGPWLNILGNRAVTIFRDANPLPFQSIPVVPWRGVRDPGFFYGIGLIDIMKSMHKTMNVVLNQRLDNLNAVLNPMWKVRRSGAIATRQLVMKPNGYVHVNQPDDVTTVEMPDVTQNAMSNMRDLLSWVEMGTGIQEFFRGEPPDTSRFPASGISLLLRATTGRFKMTTASYFESLKKVIAMTHEINKEYMDPNVIARFSSRNGFQFPSITKDKFNSTFLDLIPVGKTSSGNPDFLLQKLVELSRDWAEKPYDHKALDQTILELAGMNNIAEIIPPTPEAEPGAAGTEVPVEGEIPPGGDPNALLEMLGTLAEGGQPGAGGEQPIPYPEGGEPQGAPITPLALQPTVTDTGGDRMMRVPQ